MLPGVDLLRPVRPAGRLTGRYVRAGRRADVQGLRALAVALVVVFHAGAGWLPGGFVGVDVFFVISGFVITGMLAREWARNGRVSFAAFYARRFQRLAPASAVVVTVTLVAFAVLGSPAGPAQQAAATGAAAMVAASNVVIAMVTGGYFDAPAEVNPLLNMWSLSVEEQFYLVFPAVLVAGWWVASRVSRRAGEPGRVVIERRARQVRVGVLAVAAVGAASFVLAVAGSRGWPGGDPWWGWLAGFYSPATRAWEFAAGALLALLTTGASARRRGKFVSAGLAVGRAVLGLAGVAAVVVAAVRFSEAMPWPGAATLLPVAGTVAVIAAGPTGLVGRVLAWRPIVSVGDASYSIYLWHWPVIVLMVAALPGDGRAAAIGAVASLLPAWWSYRVVEGPYRRGARRHGRALVRWALVALAVPCVTAGLLWAGADRGFGIARVQSFLAAVVPYHAGHAAGCDRALRLSAYPDGACVLAEGRGAPVYLVGDSNADQYAEALIGAGADLGRPVVAVTGNSCPVAGVWQRWVPGDPWWNKRCRAYSSGVVEDLLGAEPGTVVIAATDRYVTDPNYAIGVDRASASTVEADKAAALVDGLTSVVTRLREAGHDVVLVAPIPRWAGAHPWDPSACSTFTIASGGCVASAPVKAFAAQTGPWRQVLDAAAAAGGAQVLDVTDQVCPDGMCSTWAAASQMVRYKDDKHLSVPQSRALAPVLAEALSASGSRS